MIDHKKIIEARFQDLSDEFDRLIATEGPSEATADIVIRLDELNHVLDMLEELEVSVQRARDLVQRGRKPRLRVVEEER